MADPATACVADLIAKLTTVTALGSTKVLSVMSEEDFSNKTKLVKTPFAGVMYSGLQSNQADPSRQGMAADLVVAVVYGFASSTMGVKDPQPDAWVMLDAGRKAIRLTQAPTGHKWRFQSESYVGIEKGIAFYLQQWSTFVALTSG